MTQKILQKQKLLVEHPLYSALQTPSDLRIFMKYHVFAVWDFMSLLKGLQRDITCVEVPWKPSRFNPLLVQLINEIVLGEESDVDQRGLPCSHFQLYLKAMKEVGADTVPITEFLKDLDLNRLDDRLRTVIEFHLRIAQEGKVHEKASCFFFGRENLIPEMFTQTLRELRASRISCDTLIYYLQRHIEVDGENHGPKALMCLNELTSTEEKKVEAESMALEALEMRQELWDYILDEILTHKEKTVLSDRV